jgi:hypothetical protein
MVDPATRAANGASRREEAHAFPIQAAGVRRFARCARRTPTDGRWMRIAAMSRHQRGARQRKNACLRSPKDPNANRRMGRSSGFRIGLLTAPSRPARSRCGRDLRRTVVFAAFVPGYSGGTATDSHRLPYSSSGPQAETTPTSRVILTRAERLSTHAFAGLIEPCPRSVVSNVSRDTVAFGRVSFRMPRAPQAG